MVLALTHEEVVTFHVASIVRSYRQLPFSLYHFQTKGRDEARPRAGLLRTREFIMKDAYTFDRDRAGLDEHYEHFRGAYDAIFDRVGLEWYRVESDVGMMGGIGAHEYMAPCAAGENDVALAPGYAANVEVASAEAAPVELPEPLRRARGGPDARPDHDRRGRGRSSRCPRARCSRRYPVIVEGRGLVLVRRARRPPGQRHQAHQRARAAVPRRARGRVRPAHRARRLDGPGRRRRARAARRRRRAGAVRHRRQPRRLPPARASSPAATSRSSAATSARVEPGDTVDGHPIRIEPAIEVGNIFKLGTRYSEPFGATYLDESGAEQLIWMGSYGIGPARICAAAVEQFADEQGISWPRSISPFDVHLVGLGKRGHARSARWPSGSTTSCARPASTSSTTTARTRAGREVRRRRAARLPAAPDRRQALARLGRDRGAGPARAGSARAPARGRRAGGAELWRTLA